MDDEYVDSVMAEIEARWRHPARPLRPVVRFYPSSVVPGTMIRLVTVRVQDATRLATVTAVTERKWIGLRTWWRWRRINRGSSR